MNVKDWLKNSRFYILLFSAALAAFVYIYVKISIPLEISQATKLDQVYGLIGIAYLYLALLATPLTQTFNTLPFGEGYIFARRAIGVGAFFFSVLHTYFSFFKELGGFEGLGFLDNKYLLGIALGFIALIVFFLLALTSFDFAIEKLTYPKWKLLHRFVYLAGVLVVIHVLVLGSAFINLSGIIPQVFFSALVILLGLESLRFDQYLKTKFSLLPARFTFSIFLVLTAIFGTILYGPSTSSTSSPFNIHAAHIQLAKQAQSGGSGLNYSAAALNNPGLIGDRTRRFTVSFLHPDSVSPNTDVPLSFRVFDASSGNAINLFQFVYSKTMHLVIVDNELQYFTHIHPTQVDSSFNITTQFPHPGRYHLYIDFQPLGAIEQQFAFTLDVGSFDTPAISNQSVDTNLTRTFDKYSVSLNTTFPLKAQELSVGNQTIIFTIKDAKTLQPITNLKPYLASFGHLVLINEQTYDYLHVHPNNIVAPPANSSGGPDVIFLPLGLYGPIKPGIYRAFAQFNPDNQLFVADFTVKIE